MKKIKPIVFFPIVGIGASAGGLEAASEFLKALPPNTGMAYILVSHLEPTHESMLSEILSQSTTMPTREVKEGMGVEPNHVYIIPPNTNMTISNGILKLISRIKTGGPQMPIDHFFLSLAKDQGNHAIGIILSGAATDGSLGLKAIKDAGGITFAQEEKSAKYSSMPHSAIATGSVDFILTPEKIAKELTRLSIHPYLNHKADKEKDLSEIFLLLKGNKNIDFSQYKQTTLNRRIDRRMLLNKLSFLEYLKLLKDNPQELEALYQDMLITVTRFFREPEKFEALKTVVFPNILKNRQQPQVPIRIWVPGCSTGEEAYSIAICLLEFLSSKLSNIPVQIFATDINEQAIKKARLGIYPQGIVSDVSPKRLERFFAKLDGNYQIIKQLRDMCTFAPHNLTVDPTFSKLDLISCCNVLIYMGQPLQQKILSMFHYALNPAGFLMLGDSETIGNSTDIFLPMDKKHKIYSRKQTATRPHLDFYTPATKEKPIAAQINSISQNLMPEKNTQSEIDKILISKYAPASVLVSDDLDILEFRGPTRRFLEHPPGHASLNLLKMAPESLLLELRRLIYKAQKGGKSARKENVLVNINGPARTISLEVLPIKNSFFLILFEEPPATLENPPLKLHSKKANREIKQLEQELSDTQKYLQSIIKEHDTTNEELKAANEEMLSSNEELQSINEELETSKEEIQSTNEELITVNEELQNRNEQLRQAGDLNLAIIETVREPLVILNGSLRVQSANSAFYKSFQVTKEQTEGILVYELGQGQWNIPKLRRLLEDILPKKTQFTNFEVEHRFPTIGHKIMLLNARQIKELKLILLAIEDVTEKREIERHQKMEQRKDEFITLASHELKTPITTIKGYTDILTKQFKKTKQVKYLPYVSKMDFQISRLTALVNELLDVSKIQTGKLDLHKEDIKIDNFIKGIVLDMQQTNERHHLSFESNTKNTMIAADKYRLSQVMVNLISNAIKYSPKSDKVAIKTKLDKDHIIVSIQDFGIGISVKDQPKIFDRFFQAQTNIRQSSFGLGLGLYISAEIIKRHKGKIWVDSVKGHGSTFYFKLPITKNP